MFPVTRTTVVKTSIDVSEWDQFVGVDRVELDVYFDRLDIRVRPVIWIESSISDVLDATSNDGTKHKSLLSRKRWRCKSDNSWWCRSAQCHHSTLKRERDLRKVTA
jgi:hypothetical protein